MPGYFAISNSYVGTDINLWIKGIITRFWPCVKTSNTAMEFLSKWKGGLYHITEKHSWVFGEGFQNQCEHDEIIDNDKPLIISGSPPHVAIRKIIWDDKFLKTIVHLLNFRSTSVIENFNNLILKYASKRIPYRFSAYEARNQVAALDYSHNKDREYKVDKNGAFIWKRKYNKSSKRWTVYKKKKDKEYSYIPMIMNDVKSAYNSRKSFETGFNPALISPTIAPIPPPDTIELAEKHCSRFS